MYMYICLLELPQLASSNEFTQNVSEKISRKINSVIYKLAIKMYSTQDKKFPQCRKYPSSPEKVSSYLPFDKPFASRPSKFIISAD